LHPERGVTEFEATLRELLANGHTARFRASGDSMYPAIRSGDYLHIVQCDPSELRRGDVVLAAMERGLTAHRIVRIGERDGALAITTRGDNALRSDPPIEAGDILGRVAGNDRAASVPRSIAEPPSILRLAAVVARRLRARLPVP
jgi:signal peptidase I